MVRRKARALPIACELAQALAARLVLVTVAGGDAALDQTFTKADRQAIAEQYGGVREEDHVLSIDPWQVEHAQRQVRAIAMAEDYLAREAVRLSAVGIEVETAVAYGEAAQGILNEIELRSIDLVVMTRRDRSGLHRLIGGSVAQEIMASSRAPVLLVPREEQVGTPD